MILKQKSAREWVEGVDLLYLLVPQGEGCGRTFVFNSFNYEEKIIKLGWA